MRGRSLVTVALLVAGGCKSSPFDDITETLAAEIVTLDTTIFDGGSLVVRAQAEYRFGVGAPQTIQWGVSDTATLAAFIQGDLSASVSGKDTGDAYVIALINETFLDSILISVVNDGSVRWRRLLAGDGTLLPAITDDSLVVVAHGVTAPRVLGLRPGGDTAFSFTACSGYFGPTVSPGKVFTTGAGCTARADTSGAADWTATTGDYQSGVALAGDGSVVIVHSQGQPPDVVVVSRISAQGAVSWRDTLRSEGLLQSSAPAIAQNGDIYVPWRAPADSAWLTRITASGAVRWTVPLPGAARLTSPAIMGNTRVVVGHQGGVTAFDSAGAVVWSRAFTDDLPMAASDAAASSPVLDVAGNVFVQTEAGLVSYLAGGTTQWAADSLGFGATTGGVGGPTLLIDGTLVVPCVRGAGREVCSVGQGTGELAWRSAVGGGAADGLVVGREGTIFATRTLAGGTSWEVVALWHRGRLDPVGWPTDGRTSGRTRSAN